MGNSILLIQQAFLVDNGSLFGNLCRQFVLFPAQLFPNRCCSVQNVGNKIADKDFVATAKRRLGTLNKAQLAGYAFSGLVLGLGIPNLNIYITKKKVQFKDTP